MPRTASAIKDPNTLKRNQACHQCRRRKLKCDAGHPCVTCVRSHAFALRSAQAANGNGSTSDPPALECTYDDAPNDLWQDNAQTKFERLENKITLLENLLRESNERIQNQALQLSQPSASTSIAQQSSTPSGSSSSPGQDLFSTPSSLEMGQDDQGTSPNPTGFPSFQFSVTQALAGGSTPSTTIVDKAHSLGSSPAASSPGTHTSSDRPSPPNHAASSRNSAYGHSAIAAYLQANSYGSDITIEDQACTVQALDAIGTLEGSYDPYSTTLKLKSTDPEHRPSASGFHSLSGQQARFPRISPRTLVEFGVDPMDMTLDLGLGGHLLQGEVEQICGNTAVLHQAWPQFLPPPDLLLHLVDTFFTCHPHAGRILHRGTFMTNLTYPPTSPQFPLPALLHAICAVASFYTAVVDPPVMPSVEEMTPEEIFYDPKSHKAKNPSFGETHAMWATLSAARAIQSGEKMLQVVQSTIILAWFQYTSGSSVNVWILIGKACRITSPLGINISPAFGTLSRFNRTPALIPPPKNAIDAEQRRNLFWLIYSAERFHTAGTCWSMLLDDEDISQFFPIGDDEFNAGKEIPDQTRQRIATPNVLLVHPPEVTSSFTLFIKSTILLSKVKVFNVRFRTKYGDLHGASDPRDTAEFQELDKLLQDFRHSWPKEYKDPVNMHGKVDGTLYLASIVAPTATILLHDPHADFNSIKCPSAKRMTEAAAVIMESIYKLSSTSFDVLLLDHVTSFSWFVAGACLIRILKAKMAAGATADMIRVNSEIDIIRMMLLRLGERTIIGRRQIKLLNEHYAVEINGPSAFLRAFASLSGQDARQMFLNSPRMLHSMAYMQKASNGNPITVRDIMNVALQNTSTVVKPGMAESSRYLTPTQGSLGAMLQSCSPGSSSAVFPESSPLAGAIGTPDINQLQAAGLFNSPGGQTTFGLDPTW